jgi:hypothetical protein
MRRMTIDNVAERNDDCINGPQRGVILGISIFYSDREVAASSKPSGKGFLVLSRLIGFYVALRNQRRASDASFKYIF